MKKLVMILVMMMVAAVTFAEGLYFKYDSCDALIKETERNRTNVEKVLLRLEENRKVVTEAIEYLEKKEELTETEKMVLENNYKEMKENKKYTKLATDFIKEAGTIIRYAKKGYIEGDDLESYAGTYEKLRKAGWVR